MTLISCFCSDGGPSKMSAICKTAAGCPPIELPPPLPALLRAGNTSVPSSLLKITAHRHPIHIVQDSCNMQGFKGGSDITVQLSACTEYM